MIDRALARLRDPSGEALRDLARLVVDEATATPVREIAAPRWIAGQIATALEAATRTDRLRELAARRVEEGRERWLAEERPLRDFVPPEVHPPLVKLLERPYTLDEALTTRIIDHGVFRDLLAEVLETTLKRFVGRVRDFDQEHLGGFARQAKSLGKGLLGGMAQNLGRAVKGELEHVLERRVTESLGALTNEALRVVARHLTDPAHAEDYGRARVTVLEVLLDTPVKDLAREIEKAHPEEVVDVVVAAVRSAVAQPDFVDRTAEKVERALATAGDGTLGAWLDEVQLREVWTETTTELVAQRLTAVVTTDAFERWWTALFA